MTDENASTKKEKQSEKAQRFRLNFGDETLDGGFTQLPNNFLRYYHRIGVTVEEAMFIVHLIQAWYDFLDREPSLRRIARRMRRSRRQVQRYSQRLEKRGLIVVYERYYEQKDDQGDEETQKAKGTGAQLENEYDLAPLIQAVNAFFREEIDAAKAAAEEKKNRLNRERRESAQMRFPLDSDDEGATPAEHLDSPDEHSDHPDEHPATPAATFLQELGVTEPTLSQIADLDQAVARAWWWYIQTQPGLEKKGIELNYLITRLRSNDAPPPGLLALAQAWVQLPDEQRWALLQAERNYQRYGRDWNLPDDFPALSEEATQALEELVRAEIEFGVASPEPVPVECPGCGKPYWPDLLCTDCGRCKSCCACEVEVEAEAPALVEAREIWKIAATLLKDQMMRSDFNFTIQPLQAIALDGDTLQLAVRSVEEQNLLNNGVNQGGLIDRAISDAAGRTLKAEFVVPATETDKTDR